MHPIYRSHEDEFDFYKQKIKRVTYRREIADGIYYTAMSGQASEETILEGFKIATLPLMIDEPGVMQGHELARRIGEAVSSTPKDKNHLFNSYLENLDSLIDDLHKRFHGADLTKKIFDSTHFVNNLFRGSLKYRNFNENADFMFDGKNIRISHRMPQHESSILIKPDDPQNAVGVVPWYGLGDVYYNNYPLAGPTILDWVLEYHGTDGKFAQHYHKFLDCRDKYPGHEAIFNKIPQIN